MPQYKKNALPINLIVIPYLRRKSQRVGGVPVTKTISDINNLDEEDYDRMFPKGSGMSLTIDQGRSGSNNNFNQDNPAVVV
ncbi:hypothetical protein LCGC14_2572360, partial [marine sediment metagenome]